MTRTTKTACQHLSPDGLQAFEDGALSEERVAAMEAHLADCDLCCEMLSGLPESEFLKRLRLASRCRSSTTAADRPTQKQASRPLSLPGFSDVCELGRGGMGIVYAATHSLMGRRVAVKVIHPEVACHPAAVERFRCEVQAAARLSHPHIVTAHDAGQVGDRLFLVMEFIDGESLAERLQRLGPLPVAEACEAVRQAALGVQHAHEHGLVHRDLKPHNLMRTRDGVIKVCDFGLAALSDDRAPGARTIPNAVLGTPDYMAPEQAEDARQADGRADVYSLGCTLYHLLTGQVPFTEESTLLKLLAHRSQARPSASRLRPEVPEELNAVLQTAMAREPNERYPTPGALAEALRPFAVPAQGVRARRTWRRPATVLASFVLLSLVAAAGVVRFPAGKDREIVIETDDPDIEVVARGERIIRIVDPKTGKAYRLDREDLTLSLIDEPDGLAVSLDGRGPVVLKRQGKQIATVRLTPRRAEPTPARAGNLFNGKDLSGWVLDGGRAGSWRVQEGELVGVGNGYLQSGYLLTERSFENFELRFEYQLAAGANSGVALRAVPGERGPGWPPVPEHLEVQLLDDDKHSSGHTGSLYWSRPGSHLRPDQRAKLKSQGSWNEMRLECRGATLRVWVNGEKVQEVDLDRLANQSDARAGLNRSSGRIGLQQHTGEVRFRNIELQELPRAAKSDRERSGHFFNGKDLSGWQGLPGYWRVEDGTIVGAFPEGRTAHTFLVSQRSYRNFDLKFQARRKDGVGNSGVQFRSRISDPGKLTVVGPQCEIDALGHNFPPGSLLTEPDLKPLAVRASREALADGFRDEEFNDYHIRCVGKHVTIRVNGVITIDDNYPDLPDEGVIAWQLNGFRTPREVCFRNIAFTDLGESGARKSLLDGKGLAGWLVEGDESRFRVEDGVLIANSPHFSSRGYLLHAEPYDNFLLRFECLLEEKASSGVVVRAYRGERSDFERPGTIDHPIIKLADGRAYPTLPSGGSHWIESGNHDGPTPRAVDFPLGEWNEVEIQVKADTCQVWINRAHVIHLKLNQSNRIGKMLAGLARERGHVGFQAHTGTVRYRRIEIERLPSSE